MVKRGFRARRRRKKVLKLAKGYRGSRSKLYRTARNAVSSFGPSPPRKSNTDVEIEKTSR